jgi:hypothetical protein
VLISSVFQPRWTVVVFALNAEDAFKKGERELKKLKRPEVIARAEILVIVVGRVRLHSAIHEGELPLPFPEQDALGIAMQKTQMLRSDRARKLFARASGPHPDTLPPAVTSLE